MSDRTTTELLDWYRSEFSEHFCPSTGGGNVRFAHYKGNSTAGLLVIVPGRTEFIEKYLEVAWDLRMSGYGICIYDHCGQGRSERLLEERDKGHISDFTIYVDDLHRILDASVRDNGPVILLSHSMGGIVATRFCQIYPGRADGLILVSPMLKINTGQWKPPLLIETLCTLLGRLGTGESYAWGTGPYDPNMVFDANVLTSDPRRSARTFELIELDPQLALGGPTFGWLGQAYKAMRAARHEASQPACPVLLLRGLGDTVVGLSEMQQFCLQGDNRTLVSYPGARHELLMERDTMRGPAIERINSFLKQYNQ